LVFPGNRHAFLANQITAGLGQDFKDGFRVGLRVASDSIISLLPDLLIYLENFLIFKVKIALSLSFNHYVWS